MFGKKILLLSLLAALVWPGFALAQNQASPPGIVLAGDWSCGDGVCRILQNGDALTFINATGESSSGRFIRANAVVADNWDAIQGRLGAYYNGNRMAATEARDHFGIGVSEILWANGMVWTRLRESLPSARVQNQKSPPAVVLAGDWNCGDRMCRILQNGVALTFINASGESASGRFVRANAVVADDWDGIQGNLGAYYNGNRMAATEARDRFGIDVSEILWANGMVWTRVQQSQADAREQDRTNRREIILAGDWSCGDRVCRVLQNGDALTFINDSGENSSGRFIAANVVFADNWDGIQASLGAYYNGNRIAATEARDQFGIGVGEILWANGMAWTRMQESQSSAGAQSPLTGATPAKVVPGTPIGNYFEGDIFNARGGKGLWVSTNGDRYEGDFVSGKPAGTGFFRYSDGQQYQGQVANGLPNGRGSYLWANGNRYDGEFRDGKITGRGEIRFTSGDSYVGDFVDGIYTGRGTLVFADGSKYDGDFVSGEFQGRGTYSSGGRIYDGEFVNGQFHGRGSLTLSNGERRVGIFANGKYVSD